MSPLEYFRSLSRRQRLETLLVGGLLALGFYGIVCAAIIAFGP